MPKQLKSVAVNFRISFQKSIQSGVEKWPGPVWKALEGLKMVILWMQHGRFATNLSPLKHMTFWERKLPQKWPSLSLKSSLLKPLFNWTGSVFPLLMKSAGNHFATNGKVRFAVGFVYVLPFWPWPLHWSACLVSLYQDPHSLKALPWLQGWVRFVFFL